MRVFFLLIFLCIVADATAQQPTVTWELAKPDYAKEFPDKLKDFHGLIILERSTVKVFPVLNMIFFPKDSSSLNRYFLYTSPDQTTSYSEDNTTATLEAHYNILNSLGYRLRAHPAATIGLTGCSGNDVGQLTLAKARAETIQNYLVAIWGINANRVKITSRILPAYPSDVATEKGREENRRVEVISDDWNIMGPVVAKRYVRYPDPRRALLYVSPITDPTITDRKIKILYQHKPWATISVPNGDTTIEWNWRSDAAKLLPASHELLNTQLPPPKGILSAQLLLTDAQGRMTESSADSIEVKLIPYMTIPESPSNKRREMYHLSLRPDEEQAIGKMNKTYIDSLILPRIKPHSDMEILGYANEDSRKNRDRSEALIASIKKYIEPKTIISNRDITTKYYSNGVLFYPQYPEGRMLNRSAQIIIETPWEELGMN